MKKMLALSTLAFLFSCAAPQENIDPGKPTTDESKISMLSGTYFVEVKTSKGSMMLELYADKAPKTVTNFVTHAKDGYYNGLTFHRVIKGFMIQGGDPLGNGTGGESIYGSGFEDEINDLPMVKGMVAMANRGPNTNGSQFFIIQADRTPWLVGKHTVFGKVIGGMDVLDEIANVEVDSNSKPISPVTFTMDVKVGRL